MENEVHEKELEQLVSLAEDVSEKIERAERSRLYISFAIMSVTVLLVTLLVYRSNELNLELYKKNSDIKVLIILLFLLVLAIFVLASLITILNRKNLITEKIVLRGLLDLISTHKELAYGEMTVVSKAVFDMRLNRIKFSSKSFHISE